MFSIAKVGYQAQVIPALLPGWRWALLKLALNASYRITLSGGGARLFADPRGVPRPCAIGPFGRMIGDGVAFAVRHLIPAALLRLVRHCLASCTRRWYHRRTPDHPCY